MSMDPNEALATIRDIVALYEAGGLSDKLAALDELAGTVGSLDEWLSRRGPLPSDWQH
jgi:hypothetical protein